MMRKSFCPTLLALILASARASPAIETAVAPGTPVAVSPAENAPPAATRQPRSALEATDPSTVSPTAGQPQLVEFFAFWCTPCQGMAPIVHGLEDRYSDGLIFSYLDIDDPATADFRSTLGFRDQPEFYLLDAQGTVIQKWVRPMQEQVLVKVFDAVLGQQGSQT